MALPVRAPERTAAEPVPDLADRRLTVLPPPAPDPAVDLDHPARWEEIRAVHSDLRLIAQDLADDALRDRVHDACARLAALGRPPEGEPAVRLSPRETDVLAMVALGFSNAEAARRLSLGPETVKSYLSGAMAKLDAHTRHEAVVHARRLGLLP